MVILTVVLSALWLFACCATLGFMIASCIETTILHDINRFAFRWFAGIWFVILGTSLWFSPLLTLVPGFWFLIPALSLALVFRVAKAILDYSPTKYMTRTA